MTIAEPIKDCNNNPVRYWDPTGHVTTAWDTKNLNRAQLAALAIQTRLYDSRIAQGDTAGAAQAHADAETIRNTARSNNEIGSASGYTYKVNNDGSASLNKYDSAALDKISNSSTTVSGNSASITLNGSSYIPERYSSTEKIITENFNSILPAFMTVKSTNNVQPNQNIAQGQNIDLNNLYGVLVTDVFNLYNNLNYAGYKFKEQTQKGKLDWFLKLSLAATKGGDGNYHISQDWWQSWEIVGYNKIYDLAFDAASEMSTAQFDFEYKNEKFRIWAWKGDYINLGAGTELGIYYGGGPHWKTGKDYAMPMTLTLDYNGDRIISYDPVKDDPKGQDTYRKWWITGFDPSTPDVLAEDLTSVFTLNFSESKEMKGMYDAFYREWHGVDDRWDFSIKYHPTFTFREEK